MSEIFQNVDVLSQRYLKPDEEPLSKNEAKNAREKLNIPLFKSVVRVKKDPEISSQRYGLFSFTPALGVTPNKYGVFGTAKLRGNFQTEEDAAIAAEQIVRNVDSTNEIYTVVVGQSFPLTKETKFVKEFSSVKFDEEVEQVEKEREIRQRKKEKETTKAIVDRERQLLQEHKQILDGTFEEDPLDVYIRLQVKRSQLMYTLEITEKRIKEEINPAIQKTLDQIEIMDKRDSSLRKEYVKRYLDARAEAGLETDFKCNSGTQLDFMKYLDINETKN